MQCSKYRKSKSWSVSQMASYLFGSCQEEIAKNRIRKHSYTCRLKKILSYFSEDFKKTTVTFIKCKWYKNYEKKK